MPSRKVQRVGNIESMDRALHCNPTPLCLGHCVCVCDHMTSSGAGCGRTCTTDGIHYTNNTYDAAVQIWLNVISLN